MSRLVKVEQGAKRVVQSKDLMLKLLVYYNLDTTHKSALITLHTLMVKVPNCRQVLLDQHNFTMANFDSFITKGKASYHSSLENEKWEDYVFVCSSLA